MNYVKIYYPSKPDGITIYTFDNVIIGGAYNITLEEAVHKMLTSQSMWGNNIKFETEEDRELIIKTLKKTQKIIDLKKLSDYA